MAGTMRIADGGTGGGRTFSGSKAYSLVPLGDAALAIKEPARFRAPTGRNVSKSTGGAPVLSVPGRAPFAFQIDLRDMYRLGANFERIGVNFTARQNVISRSINHGLRKLRTQLKRDLVSWTGNRRSNDVRNAFRIRFAHPGLLRGALTVTDKHTKIDAKRYGASWSRGRPGVSHAAWNRRQIAKGSFMPAKLGFAVTRTSKSRLPLQALWGPNMAREIERHAPEVQTKLNAVGIVVAREAARLLRIEIAKAAR